MIKVISLNVRLDVPSDGIHNYWFRKDAIYQFIDQSNADLIALQEVLPSMYDDICNHFKAYHIYGIPRDSYGESIPVLVRKDVFEVVNQKTKWLSDTPDVLSKFPNSAFPRIITYVKLKHRVSHKELLFINTHLDYLSDDISNAQAKVLEYIIKDLQKDVSIPVIFLGDFNQTPSSMTITFLNQTYHHVFEDMKPMPLTFHGFTHPVAISTIDYIFYSHQLKLLDVSVYKEKMLSDHYPIIAHFYI